MRAIICSNCGGSDFRSEKGYMVCNYCDSKFKIDDSNRPSPQSTIALGNDVERLLKKCQSDPKRAKKYANLILDIDPTNQEALKYL